MYLHNVCNVFTFVTKVYIDTCKGIVVHIYIYIHCIMYLHSRIHADYMNRDCQHISYTYIK